VKRSFDRRFTRSSSARRLLAGALAALVLLPFAATAATEPASCRIVRFSDIGWTDVTATTGLASHLVRLLGYEPKVTVLSVPVTFASIKNGDIDVFLGNWMPAQAADLRPYQDDGSVEVVGANLEGAKYTLAVPAYLHEAGLRDFGDIRRFAGELEHQIYGIEPGNDGNRLVLDMIKSNEHGLGDFKLVESSEQGMLSQVERAIAAKRPIVFFGWEPHPMNTRFEMRYLTGGDSSFGPNYGGATVYTNVRAGYLQQCPNVGRLVRNLKFTLRAESEIMQGILDRKLTPEAAGEEWLRRNPGALGPWFEGVTTFDGQPAPLSLDAPTAAAAKRAGGFEAWVTAHKIPLGATVESAIEFIKANGRGFFAAVSAVIQGSVDGLVIVSALFSTLIGVPIGIAAAHRPRLFAALRPVLDLMQTLPTFVYLIPTLVLFGLGVVPGLISTVIFAVPAPIRLTHLGISSVPRTLLEAGDAFGATPMQRLWKIELPSARPTILAGITQCIMLSLSMVVIAALVGAGGLGVPVVRALNSVQVDIGFEAGIAIVLLAIILDRISRPGRGGPQE
jgi:glycine betaine/proline transport system substrate-binding protein